MSTIKPLCNMMAIVISALSLAACSGEEPAGDGDGPRTLVVDINYSGDLRTADPGRMLEVTGYLVDRQLYDTLLTFEEGDLSEVVPSLAESFEASKDAKTYTFILRDDIEFSDGTPMTSADVVFSLNRLKNLKGNPSYLMDGLSVSAPDETTVVIQSQTPNPAIPRLITQQNFGVLNSKLVKEHGGTDAPDADSTDKAEDFLNQTSAGSGAYVLESFSTTTEVVFKRNSNYWGPEPAYDRVVLRNVEEPTQLTNIQQGESQVILNVSTDQAGTLPKDGSLQVFVEPSTLMLFIFANTDPSVSEVAADRDVWEAIRYGIDYDSLLELGGEGTVQPSSVIPYGVPGALPEAEAPKQDVERAKAALERSGIPNPTVELEFPSDMTTGGADLDPIAERVQSNLKEIGLNVQLAPVPLAKSLETWRAGEEELGMWDIASSYGDPSEFLTFTPGGDNGSRANWEEGDAPEVEELAKDASTSIDEDERAQLYSDLAASLNESSPFFPLLQPAKVLVAAPSVTNVKFDPALPFNFAKLGYKG